MRSTKRLLLLLTTLLFSTNNAAAQVGPGVVSLPANGAIASGEIIVSGTTVNVSVNGVIGSGVNAGDPGGGSTLVNVNLFGGSIGDDFSVNSGAILTLPANSTGAIGEGLTANFGSTVSVSGGSIGSGFQIQAGSNATILGGTIGDNFQANQGSIVFLAGGEIQDNASVTGSLSLLSGSIGDDLTANTNSLLSIQGGEIGDGLTAGAGSNVSIGGGAFLGSVRAEAGSEITLTVDNAFVDGVLLPVPVGGTTVIARDVTLSGALNSTGEPFSFDLNAVDGGDDFFSPNATITIVRPQSNIPGDFNGDGFVDASDFTVWRDNLGAPANSLPNDFTGQSIGIQQYIDWQNNFGAGVPLSATVLLASVPEPSSLTASLALTLGFAVRRRRP